MLQCHVKIPLCAAFWETLCSAQKDFGSTTELISLLNSAVVVHWISLKCWVTLLLGISPLICPSSCVAFLYRGGIFVHPNFKQSLKEVRLAKISWRRGAAVKGNFVGPCAIFSFVWCMKKTRKPEDQEWHFGCCLEVQEFIHLVFQKRFPELIKGSGFIGKGFSYNDKHTCHNDDLMCGTIVWSVGQLSNTI